MSAASRRAQARAASGRRAGLVSRLLVAGVDFVVVGLILFGLFVVWGVVRYMVGIDETFTLPDTGPLLTGIGFPVVEFFYLALAWSVTGRTTGKLLFGLRAINADGKRLGPSRACARAAWCTVFGIPSLLWAGVSSRNAAVHDLVFRTAVVHDWSTANELSVPASVPAPAASEVVAPAVGVLEIVGVVVPGGATIVSEVSSATPPAPERTSL